ncbi:MAG TPA: inorganic phosphate transporter [Caulobacteraceae bacterium]|jgi:PiT family inorganic phosphate transporter|nr:inorganic phosphate transporter [Caulobacteraceae bacterium]
MTDAALSADVLEPGEPKLDERPPIAARIVFIVLLVCGLAYGVYSLRSDITGVGETVAFGVFALLGVALLIALAFEFVNGFHDTANAVATVIYTHSMHPVVAVIWSGFFNFVGVVLSSGAVAYSIVTLLPVELILQVGSTAGYAMIFSLLLAAIIWNLGTWWLGIPNSSSHALIGSIMGVGLANQLMAPVGQATSGVDWSQAGKVFQALLFSPVVGFIASALLLLLMKFAIREPQLYQEPKSDAPPPWWIRGLLILTCTGVSFAHGGNDGQKGMGLIMLILIGAAPTAYALNRTMPDATAPAFEAAATKAQAVFAAHSTGAPPVVSIDAARSTVGDALRTQKVNDPAVYASLATLSGDIAAQVKQYGSIKHVPAAATPNLRNDMYLASDATRLLTKGKNSLSKPDAKTLKSFQGGLETGTRFIPTWVKVSVAIALGLGTMVGWKRIVVTVGEKIGKTHLTYAQGASAELVAAVTILGAQVYGLPVSTTHILSSGVAGTMAANGSGLQGRTLLNIALAWILTLPAAIALAGSLYFILRHVF